MVRSTQPQQQPAAAPATVPGQCQILAVRDQLGAALSIRARPQQGPPHQSRRQPLLSRFREQHESVGHEGAQTGGCQVSARRLQA